VTQVSSHVEIVSFAVATAEGWETSRYTSQKGQIGMKAKIKELLYFHAIHLECYC